MQWIEGIEQVFTQPAMDKAPFAVVKIDGNESQAGNPARRKHAGSHDGLDKAVFTQYIQHQDERIAHETVIGTEKECEHKDAKNGQSPAPRLFFKVFQQAHPQHPEKQGEQDILAAKQKRAVGVDQIPRQFRQESKQQQIQAIAFPAAGMEKTLHYQERKDGKSQPPEHPAQEIRRYGVRVISKQRNQHIRTVLPKESSQMVHQHGRHSDEFERAAAENLILHTRSLGRSVFTSTALTQRYGLYFAKAAFA